jgi:hypothetical protein
VDDQRFSIDALGGECPTQAWGRLDDGRPFYFRARHGEWDLEIGPIGADTDGSWIGELRWVVARGIDPTGGRMPDEDVRAILIEYLNKRSAD